MLTFGRRGRAGLSTTRLGRRGGAGLSAEGEGGGGGGSDDRGHLL